MRRAAPALLAAALLWAPAAATAADVDGATLRELARQAVAGDPAARAELLDVTAVDGRPVDVAGLLGGADAAEEQLRLQALAAGYGPAAGGDAAEVRREAEDVLASVRFGRGDLAPGRSLLRRILEAFDDFAAWLLPSVAGDSPGWMLAGLVVLLAGVALAARAVRRRTRPDRQRPGATATAPALEDPDELARAAAAAGAAGDYATEVRLRFRAGLLYLDRRDLLPLDPAMTTGRLARSLPSPAARGVAATFDAVVYGERRATPDDARAARDGWAEILAGRP